MSLLDLDQARALVPNALTEAEFQSVIDQIEAIITARIGEPQTSGSITVTETIEGGHPSLFLKRPISSVTSVTENDEALTVADDLRIWAGQGRLERLAVGGIWGAVVVVVYVPTDQTELRKSVITDLLRVHLSRQGYQAENIAGEYSYTAINADAEMIKIMKRLEFESL